MRHPVTAFSRTLRLSVVALSLAVPASAAASPGQLSIKLTPTRWCSPAPYGAFIVGDNDPPYFSFQCSGEFVLRGDPSGSATAGQQVWAQVDAPAGITITGASAIGLVQSFGAGWVEDSFYSGGDTEWPSTSGMVDPAFASPYWGLQVLCASTCTGAGEIQLSSITLSATESQGPSVVAQGTYNLWQQNRPGEWIWNPPGDPWPLTLAGSDPSGVCNMWASVDGKQLQGPSSVPDSSQWQQCPNPTWSPDDGASIDTRDFVKGLAPFPLRSTRATPQE